MSVPAQPQQANIIPVLARSFSSSQANLSPRTPRRRADSPEEDDGDTFNIAEYNNSKLRETKVKTNTMMYRRETLKQNLSQIPTPLLLQRVPNGTVKTDSGLDQVITKTKVVKAMQKPKIEPKAGQSKGDLWKLLAKKYDGKPIEDTASIGRSVQSRKTPRPVGTPNTMGSKKKSPRTFGTPNTMGSKK